MFVDRHLGVGRAEVELVWEDFLATAHDAAHLGYIPGHRVLGLSKIVRFVEIFSRRL